MNAHYPTSEAAWSRHRELITQLYHRDGLSLDRVKVKMANEHGFKATTKMYKTRFKAWGLTKYAKHGASAPTRKREASGGGPVAAEDAAMAMQLFRDQRRPGFLDRVPSDEFSDGRASWDSLSLNPVSTWVDSSLLNVAGEEERVLFFVNNYFRYCFKSTEMAKTSLSGEDIYFGPNLAWGKGLYSWMRCYVFSSQGYRGALFPETFMFKAIQTSIYAIQQADVCRAGIHWQQAFKACETNITAPDPFFVLDLIRSWWLLVIHGIDDVALLLQRHISNVASVKLSAQHPVRCLSAALAKLPLCMVDWLGENIDTVLKRVLGSPGKAW